MKNYQMIRGQIQEDRCTNKTKYGSPLYCTCGCQTPRDSDSEINLSGVAVTRKDDNGYASFILSRDGQECGSINTQYNYIFLDGVEFLGVEESFIRDLINQALAIKTESEFESAGSTLEETAAFVRVAEEIDLMDQDARNQNNPGYCTRCHSYCWGDCEA